VASDRDVDREAATAILLHPGPSTRDGLLRSRETLMWRLEASAHELTVILEERRFALARIALIDEALGDMSDGSASEDEDEEDEDDSERDDGDVERLAGGSR
jgi:hypothetical protein